MRGLTTLPCVWVFLSFSPLWAQIPRFGVIVGAPLTSSLRPSDSTCPLAPTTVVGTCFGIVPHTKRYTAGLTIELALPARLGISVDALYSRLVYDEVYANKSPSSGTTSSTAKTVANRWEFPIMLRRKLSISRVPVFAATGIAISHVSDGNTAGTNCGGGIVAYSCSSFVQSPAQGLDKHTTGGFVLGGGLDFSVGRLRLSPQARYTRWFSSAFTSLTNQNQIQILLGMTL